MKVTLLFVFLGWVISSDAGMGSSKGRQFMVTFMHNSDPVSPQSKSGANFVYISSDQNGFFTVDAPGTSSSGAWYKEYSIQAKQTVHVTVPDNLEMSYGIATERKGILITATVEVSVYAFNERTTATTEDAYTVLPLTALSKRYIIPTAGSNPSFTVTAVDDFTSVNITLRTTCAIRNAYKDGQSFFVDLQQFDVFQLTLPFSVDSTCDFGGTELASNKPVAVTSGSSCGFITSGSGCSHLVQQVIPNELFGRKFIVTSLNNKAESRIRIIAATDSAFTSVTEHYTDGTSHTISHTMDKLKPLDLVVPAGTTTEIFNSNGLLVTKYHTGANPFSLPIPSVSAYGWNYTITTLDNDFYGLYSTFVNILLRTVDIHDLTINTITPHPSHWSHVHDLGYSYASIPLSKGASYHIEAGAPFLAQVYGTSPKASYGFNAGYSFKQLPSDGLFIRRDPPTTPSMRMSATLMPTTRATIRAPKLPTTMRMISPSTTAEIKTTTMYVTPPTPNFSCKDMKNCKALASAFDICKEPVASYKYCKKHCNLCVPCPKPGGCKNLK